MPTIFSWDATWIRVILCIIALSWPIALIYGLSLGPFSNAIVPEYILGNPDNAKSLDLFVELSKLLLTLAIGSGVAATWLYRQPKRAVIDGWSVFVFILTMMFALTSIYSGLRFIHDLATQLLDSPFDYELIRNRQWWQGWSLILELSMLSLAAVLHHFFRDKRFKGGA